MNDRKRKRVSLFGKSILTTELNAQTHDQLYLLPLSIKSVKPTARAGFEPSTL